MPIPARSLSRTAAALLLLALLPGGAALAQIAPDVGSGGTRGGRRVFENYDLRVSDPKDSADKATARAAYRAAHPSAMEAMSARMTEARAALQARVPTLQVEMNLAGRVPEVVGVSGGEKFLTAPSSVATREGVAREFLSREAAVYGLSTAEAASLVKFTDYANPAGNMSWVEFRQDMLGIPVFQGEIRFGFTHHGALARTTGNLVPGIDPATLDAKPRLNPAEAAAKAAATINVYANPADLAVKWTEENGRRSVMGGGPFTRDTRAELVWFSTEPGVAVLAWSVVLWRPLYSYYILVDANDGTLLWRKNITDHQTQPATYNVYTSDSPAPLSPTTALPGANVQAPAVARTDVTLIADDLNASPLGWITDTAAGVNATTSGNNVTAGLDLSAPDGVDANVVGTGRVFSFSYNPPPGGTDAPTVAAYRNGVVTNLFFWTNRYHDRLWQVGFTEAARNFQNLNFGRGGVGNDAVSAESQDSSGTNNANFGTPPDGSPGVMQMYIFTAPNPRRDGSLDADVFIHEMTHGTSNRLHGNATGLGTLPSGGMGEGWSDFYARCLLATADEDVNAVYASGAYVTLNLSGVGTNNYYYGIRRFPYAVLSAVGGPTATRPGRPHNPLTLADIGASTMNLNDGAYAPSPAFASNAAGEVHNVGEVWCMMLLEFRARLINRLGFAVGNQRALQIVTDAMKLDPVSPTLIQGRDSVIAAANAGPGGAVDAADALTAFALRGAGLGATSTNPTSGSISVTESFSTGVVVGAITYSDAPGNNNGLPEPGETLAVTVPLTNLHPSTTFAVSVTINGSTSSANLAPGTTFAPVINYTVPSGTACGALLNVSIGITIAANTSTVTLPLRIGTAVVGTVVEGFDGVAAPALPAGWTTAAAAATGGQAGTLWTTANDFPLDSGNYAFAPGRPGTATAGGESSLTSAPITIPAGGATFAFRHRRTFEITGGVAYDGGVLEISIAGGAFLDIVTAGGSFLANGYTGTIGATATTNPIGGRQGFTGNSAPVTTLVQLPAVANGQSVRFRWRLGFDNGFASTGWYVDTVGFGSFACAPANDADGDGLPDAYELANGLNPADPADAALDSDGDGMSNLAEFKAGTDPRNPASALRASVSRDQNGNPVISFVSVESRTYVVEYKDDLTAANWTPLQSSIGGNGGLIRVTDPIVGSAPQRFYRARIIVP